MIALLCLAALLVGPAAAILTCLRLNRRARAVGVVTTAELRHLVTNTEAWTVMGGLLLAAAALLVLAGMAVAA